MILNKTDFLNSSSDLSFLFSLKISSDVLFKSITDEYKFIAVLIFFKEYLFIKSSSIGLVEIFGKSDFF